MRREKEALTIRLAPDALSSIIASSVWSRLMRSERRSDRVIAHSPGPNGQGPAER
jgi:hypothetical protein